MKILDRDRDKIITTDILVLSASAVIFKMTIGEYWIGDVNKLLRDTFQRSLSLPPSSGKEAKKKLVY